MTNSILSISAVTLATHDMRRALRFYLALGIQLRYGGQERSPTSAPPVIAPAERLGVARRSGPTTGIGSGQWYIAQHV